PIIFLHGLLGNKKNNKTAAKRLSNLLNTTLIIPDLRNHGDSFHLRPHTNESMSNDITHLIQHLSTVDPKSFPKDSRFIVMGHSMGGKVAMIHALRYPDIVAGVISIDNIPYTSPSSSLKEFELFHLYLNHLIKHLTPSNAAARYTKISQIDELLAEVERRPLVRKFIVSNLYKDKVTHEIKSKIPLALINESIENLISFQLESTSIDSLPKYEHPALIIRATQSTFIGSDVDYPAIDKHYGDYQVIDMDCGHWIVSEKQKEFVELVSKWI
ncbi:hypothetical protein CANARDRAFT_191025, partial [[Candida] arabinofermentans NRRL YB-2248]